MSQNLSSAAVVIGTLRVNEHILHTLFQITHEVVCEIICFRLYIKLLTLDMPKSWTREVCVLLSWEPFSIW